MGAPLQNGWWVMGEAGAAFFLGGLLQACPPTLGISVHLPMVVVPISCR